MDKKRKKIIINAVILIVMILVIFGIVLDIMSYFENSYSIFELIDFDFFLY
jgi:hypothetical protein